MKKTLVIGAAGQIGTDLTLTLRERRGSENVVAADIKEPSAMEGPFEELDVQDMEALERIVKEHRIEEVYNLAAILSASAEKVPQKAWDLNMSGLLNGLELGRKGLIERIFWPSSIAVFGPSTPKQDTPQHTITEPDTVYGISKLAGERWCAYYYEQFGVDVRSLRYPGLISYRAEPGGGTTDYAVNIFHDALKEGHFECFLDKDTTLPMMYMPDAIEATIGIMEAPSEQVKERGSYNIAAYSFSPEELTEAIRKEVPELTVEYHPDERQRLADGWPDSIDDRRAREDWGWKEGFQLSDMVSDMIEQLKKAGSIRNR
jgi:nucleoside-diphosphate-sugar epimerase